MTFWFDFDLAALWRFYFWWKTFLLTLGHHSFHQKLKQSMRSLVSHF